MSKLFHRVNLLLGEETVQKFGSLRVIIFGLGGVGSWCAEGLVRNGFKKLTLVDYDTITETNCNSTSVRR